MIIMFAAAPVAALMLLLMLAAAATPKSFLVALEDAKAFADGFMHLHQRTNRRNGSCRF